MVVACIVKRLLFRRVADTSFRLLRHLVEYLLVLRIIALKNYLVSLAGASRLVVIADNLGGLPHRTELICLRQLHPFHVVFFLMGVGASACVTHLIFRRGYKASMLVMTIFHRHFLLLSLHRFHLLLLVELVGRLKVRCRPVLSQDVSVVSLRL